MITRYCEKCEDELPWQEVPRSDKTNPRSWHLAHFICSCRHHPGKVVPLDLGLGGRFRTTRRQMWDSGLRRGSRFRRKNNSCRCAAFSAEHLLTLTSFLKSQSNEQKRKKIIIKVDTDAVVLTRTTVQDSVFSFKGILFPGLP